MDVRAGYYVECTVSYPDSVRYLYSLGNEVKVGAKFGLERMQTLLAELGNPERGQRFVHVAGTNGKGSTCAMIANALRHAGLRTGLYTSPHLVEPTERIQIDGRPFRLRSLLERFEIVHAAAERLAPQRRTGCASFLFRNGNCNGFAYVPRALRVSVF